MSSIAWVFGPGGEYTATWDGVSTVTVTATSGGAFLGSFAPLATLSAAQAAVAGFIPPAAPLQLDGTAADIQAAAMAPGAGANGKAADSGHAHPVPDAFYGNLGTVLAWNYPPSQISTASATGGTPGTSATAYFLQMPLAYAQTITDLNFFITTAASGTVTHAYAGLVNSSGLVVALSADRAADSALVTSAALWSPPLSSTYAAAPGTYYAILWVLMAGGGTAPSIARCAASGSGTTLLNLGTSAASYRFSQLASQTAIVTVGNSYTLASNAISTFSAWCALT